MQRTTTHRVPALVWLGAALGLASATLAAAPPTLESLGLQPSTRAAGAQSTPGWRVPQLILVSPYLHDSVGELKEAAPGVRFIELPQASARDVANADATLGVCSAEVLAKATRLQWIQWLGAGVETCVQQPLLREHHLLLTNMQRTAAPSMAEHVIALMLALSRHLDYFLREQSQAHWAQEDTPQLTDLEGKTVLVVGLGGIGTEVARRAHALGMRVTATRASGHTGPDFVSYVGLPDELPKLAPARLTTSLTARPSPPRRRRHFQRGVLRRVEAHERYFLNVGHAAGERRER